MDVVWSTQLLKTSLPKGNYNEGQKNLKDEGGSEGWFLEVSGNKLFPKGNFHITENLFLSLGDKAVLNVLVIK